MTWYRDEDIVLDIVFRRSLSEHCFLAGANTTLVRCVPMVNTACCSPKACLSDVYLFDADREMEKLLLLIKINSTKIQRRNRAPTTLQGNNTGIPPPTRFTRNIRCSSAMRNQDQARLAITSTSSDEPALEHRVHMQINATCTSTLNRI